MVLDDCTRFTAGGFVETVATREVTIASVVPTMLRRLLDEYRAGNIPGSIDAPGADVRRKLPGVGDRAP